MTRFTPSPICALPDDWMRTVQGKVEVLGVYATAREVSATISRPDLSPQLPVIALERARD